MVGEFKQLVIVKFKEDVHVEEIMKGVEKLVSEVDLVKSLEWGKDVEGEELLRQGFTHAILLTFNKEEDYAAYACHPNIVEFTGTFFRALEKVVVLHFPSGLTKAPKRSTTSFNN
ncbi:hypothetical protein SLA2020_148620 [Shorea laevis]